MENPQNISILAACSGNSTVKEVYCEARNYCSKMSAVAGASTSVAVPKTNDDFIKNVFYEDIAGLLRQCNHRTPPKQPAVYANAASSTSRKRMTPAELAKKNSKC